MVAPAIADIPPPDPPSVGPLVRGRGGGGDGGGGGDASGGSSSGGCGGGGASGVGGGGGVGGACGGGGSASGGGTSGSGDSGSSSGGGDGGTGGGGDDGSAGAVGDGGGDGGGDDFGGGSGVGSGGDAQPDGVALGGQGLAPRRQGSKAYAQDRVNTTASSAAVSAWLLSTTESEMERAVIGAFSTAAHSGPSVLLLFCGAVGRAGGLAEHLRAAGARVLEIDILIGTRLHDLARSGPESMGDHLVQVARGGEFTAVHAAIPCESYSVAREGADVVRSALHPLGLPGLSYARAAEVWLSNALMYYVVDIALIIVRGGGQASVENPAPRGDPSLPEVYWEAKAHHASLFRVPPGRAPNNWIT